jgi:hypothetical protein
MQVEAAKHTCVLVPKGALMLNLLAATLRTVADAIDPPATTKSERQQRQERFAKIAAAHGASSEYGFRAGSKQAIIAEALSQTNGDVDAAVERLAPMLWEGTIEFCQNEHGTRTPLPLGDSLDDSQTPTQFGRLRKTAKAVNRVLKASHEQ